MKKKLLVVLALVLVCGGIFYAMTGDPSVARNNRLLGKAIHNIHTDTVLLNEVIPFEWDMLYTPGPYQSREEIAEMIGFDSPAIRENTVSEGMTHLIFVKDGRVAACVLGMPETLGYQIWLDGDNRMACEENVWFRVIRENGVIWLDDGVEELAPPA